jgi:hypothetical protein
VWRPGTCNGFVDEGVDLIATQVDVLVAEIAERDDEHAPCTAERMRCATDTRQAAERFPC